LRYLRAERRGDGEDVEAELERLRLQARTPPIRKTRTRRNS
jgi:hypothetical protein